jgi:hypothetical protein
MENIKVLKVKYTRNGVEYEQFIEESERQWWIDFKEKWEDMTTLEFEYDYTEQKAEDIRKASQECQEKILGGFDSDCLGITKHFDCEMTDQATIQGLCLTAIMGLGSFASEETHWKASGELECYKFEYAQVIRLSIDMKKHIETSINEFNARRVEILNE